LPSLRSGTRLRLVESRLKLMQVNLHAAFFLFYPFRLLRTRGIFYAGCRHFVPALGFASSNPAGCTILLKIITPVDIISCNWCFFFLLAKKLSKK